MNDTMKEDITLTEEELNFLNHVLIKIRDQAIYPYANTKLKDIRDKTSEAERKIEERRRENRPDCEEDGHTWGEQNIQNGWIIRGCKYCPKGQKRKSLEDDWETREMSEIL